MGSPFGTLKQSGKVRQLGCPKTSGTSSARILFPETEPLIPAPQVTTDEGSRDPARACALTSPLGGALGSFSVPKGAGLPSWSTSKTRCPMGSWCRMCHGPFHRAFYWLEPRGRSVHQRIECPAA